MKISDCECKNTKVSCLVPHSSRVLDTTNEQDNSSAARCRKRARLNVGGVIHEVQWKHLRNRAPKSRLAIIEPCLSRDELLERNLVDDFDEEKNEYFFDRHPEAFISILNFFRTGKLHIPKNICPLAFNEELKYWKVSDYLTESCCQGRYFERKDEALEVIKRENEREEKMASNEFEGLCFAANRKQVWDIMEEPSSSWTAKAFAIFSGGIIFVSTLVLFFDLGSERQCKNAEAENGSRGNASDGSGHFCDSEDNGYHKSILAGIEIGCAVYFTLECVIRVLISPKKLKFFKSFLDIIDFVALIPFYTTIILESLNSQFESVTQVVQFFSFLKIFRILKIMRHVTGLQALAYTFRRSYGELFLLLLSMLVGIAIFSNFTFLAEKNVDKTTFTTIWDSLWWAIITMTTVGYGDLYPKTVLGRIAGSLCCMVGVLLIALPVPIIADNFEKFYKNQKRQDNSIKRKVEMKKAKANDDIGDLTDIVVHKDSSASDASSKTDKDNDNRLTLSGTPAEIGLKLPSENPRVQNDDDLKVSGLLNARKISNDDQNNNCNVDIGNEFLEDSVTLVEDNERYYANLTDLEVIQRRFL